MTLEEAVRTVIHDLRVPEKLRTALAVYQEVSNDPNNHEIDTLWTEQTVIAGLETACLTKAEKSHQAMRSKSQPVRARPVGAGGKPLTHLKV